MQLSSPSILPVNAPKGYFIFKKLREARSRLKCNNEKRNLISNSLKNVFQIVMLNELQVKRLHQLNFKRCFRSFGDLEPPCTSHTAQSLDSSMFGANWKVHVISRQRRTPANWHFEYFDYSGVISKLERVANVCCAGAGRTD